MRWDSGIAHPLPLSCVSRSPISIKCHIQCIITNWSVFVIRLLVSHADRYEEQCNLYQQMWFCSSTFFILSFQQAPHMPVFIVVGEYLISNGTPENGKITPWIQTGVNFRFWIFVEGWAGIWQRTSKLCYAN